MEEEQKRHYKVEAGDVVTVKRQDYGQYTFYKVSLQQKMYDGTKKYFDKNIAFAKGVDIPDKTQIRIKDFFETIRENPKDAYNPIFGLFIKEYEVVEESKADALNEFNDMMSEIEVKEEEVAF